MKSLIPCVFVLGLAACSHDDHAASPSAAVQTPDCTKIVSPVQRLVCFDSVAHTPISSSAPASSSTAPAASDAGAATAPRIARLVQSNEAQRKADDYRFLLSRSREDDGTTQMVISAPALGSGTQRPLLAISCLSGITRLQFITAQPIPHNRIRARLRVDDAPVADASPWQVLDGGTIADAGRGLVAIDTLKRLPSGSRLQTESDYAPLDGLTFDASDLHELIGQQREACHW